MNHKNTSTKTIIWFFLLGIVISMLLSSCIIEALEGFEAVEGMEGLSAAEVGAIGVEANLLAEEGLALRAATGEVIVADETTFYGELSRVKVEPGGSQLSIMKNGRQLNFGEIESENSIRLKNIGQPIELPGKIFKTASNVNIRTGNGINYKVFKTVLKDRLVLVLDEQNGWCKVEIGKGEIGYMSSAYLIAASTHHHEPTQNHIETSNKNISDSSMPNDKDITNQTINNINIKSDSVRLFFRYNGSYQQNESLNNSSPMIKQVYSNNSWHTTIYYSPSIRVTQQSLQQPQNVQRQGYSSQYINSTNNSRQVDTQQLRSNQSVNNFQNSNSSHLKVVHSPVLVRRNSPTQKYSSEYKDRNSNTRQIAPRKQQNQTINNSQSKYRTSNTGQRNVQRQQTGQPINKVRNNPTQRPNYGTNYPTSKVNSTRR